MIALSSEYNVKQCVVCAAVSTEPHFGADVCRACGAFFRRRVLSRHSVCCLNGGNCIVSYENNKQCKSCRMKKCLEVGMNTSAVQQKRDRHGNPKRSPIKHTSSREQFSECQHNPGVLEVQSSSTQPNMSLLRMLHDNFILLHKMRKMIFPRKRTPRAMHLGEVVPIFMKDVKLVAQWIESAFPELLQLSRDQKRIIFRNFYIKFTVFEPAYQALLFGKQKTYHLPTGDYVDEVGRYYTNHLKHPPPFSLEEVSKVFLPYWIDFHRTLIDPVVHTNISLHEFLLLCGIFLWDVGLEGQSEESMQLADRMRRKVFEELKCYCSKMSNGNDASYRMSQNLMLLPGVQRGLEKFEEEIRMGGVYKFLISDKSDWYEIVNGPF